MCLLISFEILTLGRKKICNESQLERKNAKNLKAQKTVME
jgi:hypothetical protein